MMCDNFKRILREMVAKEYPEAIAENIELKEKCRLIMENTREFEEENRKIEEKINSIVRSMIDHNYDIDSIVRITGLSYSEVMSILAA